MKVYLGADHAGFRLKEYIKKYLKKLKYQVVDKGNTRLVMTDDYPDYAYKVA
ncbi:RpiB/LacA/LacB family sugar-phosphate isomerase, partial [Candidatus Woesearchaeota archaeon]|nr:RpiB/LacA/LacB family sugar-phosphate isomerase [Candidatus Woesearchaeota archaeon]